MVPLSRVLGVVVTVAAARWQLKNHIVVCGSLVNLFNFVQPLRSKVLTAPRPIVFLSRRPPPPDEWDSIAHFSQIYYVEGTPLSKLDLIKAGVENGGCSRTVLLACVFVCVCVCECVGVGVCCSTGRGCAGKHL